MLKDRREKYLYFYVDVYWIRSDFLWGSAPAQTSLLLLLFLEFALMHHKLDMQMHNTCCILMYKDVAVISQNMFWSTLRRADPGRAVLKPYILPNCKHPSSPRKHKFVRASKANWHHWASLPKGADMISLFAFITSDSWRLQQQTNLW